MTKYAQTEPWRAAGGCLGFAALFILPFAYYLSFPHAGFTGMVPDNIAQTAYSKLLTRPHLAGSIGSASPKAGLILLLGAAYHVSYEVLQSSWPFKVTLALVFSATLFLVNRIAATLGGEFAGIVALMVAAGSGYLTLTFFTASSNLFFIPLVLSGLLLLSKNRDRAAVLLLSTAVTVRPEALIIIASVLAIRILPARRWRDAAEFSAYGAAALLVYAGVAYWVQDSWDRIGGGAATGYPAFASLRTIEHLRVTFGQFFGDQFNALLLLPAAFVLIRLPAARSYAYFFSMIFVFLMLMTVGVLALHYRYIASAQAIVIALGCAGVFQLPGIADLDSQWNRKHMHAIFGLSSATLLALAYWSTGNVRAPLTMLSIPAIYLLAALADGSRGTAHWLIRCRMLVCAFLAGLTVLSMVNIRQQLGPLALIRHPAIQDAMEFLNDPIVTTGSGVLAEDELLNYVIVKRPDLFRKARSIQSFNVMTETMRRRELREVSFLYVSKRHNHGWNYLFYFPREAWHRDPFRQTVNKMIADGIPRQILGVRLVPVYNSETRFIARIDRSRDDAATTSRNSDVYNQPEPANIPH